MQSYIKNRMKLWEQIQFEGQKSVSAVFLGTLTDVCCTLHSVCLQKSEVHLLSFKTSPYRKILAIINWLSSVAME